MFVRGLRNGIKGFVQAFKPSTQTEALCLAVDMSTQGDDVQLKTSDKKRYLDEEKSTSEACLSSTEELEVRWRLSPLLVGLYRGR